MFYARKRIPKLMAAQGIDRAIVWSTLIGNLRCTLQPRPSGAPPAHQHEHLAPTPARPWTVRGGLEGSTV